MAFHLDECAKFYEQLKEINPNFDSCVWNDFRFPIYLNEITSIIGKGQYQINANIEIFDDQNRSMATYSCYFNLKYSQGLFTGAKFEFV